MKLSSNFNFTHHFDFSSAKEISRENESLIIVFKASFVRERWKSRTSQNKTPNIVSTSEHMKRIQTQKQKMQKTSPK